MFENLDGAKRIELAKAKMGKVLDHFLYLLELRANNAFVVYSPILSSQIPVSFTANAFNIFQRSMYQSMDRPCVAREFERNGHFGPR